MTLLADLAEFVLNQRSHGSLTADALEPVWNGYLLQVACPCGVVFGRWGTLEDAELNLMRLAQTELPHVRAHQSGRAHPTSVCLLRNHSTSRCR